MIGQVHPSLVTLNCRSMQADMTVDTVRLWEESFILQHPDKEDITMTLADIGLGKRELSIAAFKS